MLYVINRKRTACFPSEPPARAGGHFSSPAPAEEPVYSSGSANGLQSGLTTEFRRAGTTLIIRAYPDNRHESRCGAGVWMQGAATRRIWKLRRGAATLQADSPSPDRNPKGRHHPRRIPLSFVVTNASSICSSSLLGLLAAGAVAVMRVIRIGS